MGKSDETGEWLSALTAKGQTTLPRKVLDALGLKPSDKLRYLVVGGEVRLMKARSIMDMEGVLRREGRAPAPLEQMDEDIAAGASEQ